MIDISNCKSRRYSKCFDSKNTRWSMFKPFDPRLTVAFYNMHSLHSNKCIANGNHLLHNGKWKLFSVL